MVRSHFFPVKSLGVIRIYDRFMDVLYTPNDTVSLLLDDKLYCRREWMTVVLSASESVPKLSGERKWLHSRLCISLKYTQEEPNIYTWKWKWKWER